MTLNEQYQQEQFYKAALHQIAEIANNRKAFITVYPCENTWDKWSFLIETNENGRQWDTMYSSRIDWPSHFEACIAAIQKYNMLQPLSDDSPAIAIEGGTK